MPSTKIDTLIGFAVIVAGCGGGGGGGSTSPAPVNSPPSANAGSDQTVNERTPVTLSGSGEDSDGTIQSYSWIQISGSAVSLDDPAAAVVSFTAPDVAGESTSLLFRLTVTDNGGGDGQR